MSAYDNRSPKPGAPFKLRLSGGFVLSLALVAAASMLYYHETIVMPRAATIRAAYGLAGGYSFGNDFYQVWTTSRAWDRARVDPYSSEMTREIQVGLYGRPLDLTRPGDPIDQRAFPYPAFTLLLFAPAAEFSFERIRVPILCTLIALTIAAVLLWLRAIDWRLEWKNTLAIILLTLTSYPALEGLYALQLGLLMTFLLAAAIVALQRNRLLLAGVLLALTTIKPQVTALAILYLMLWALHHWRPRARFYVGFLFTLALLVGGALLVWPHWIRFWIHTLIAYRHYTQPPLVAEVISSFLGPRLAGPATLVLSLVAITIAAAIGWRNRDAAPNSTSFLMTLSSLLAITTITLLPGQAIYDHLALLPGIFLIARDRQQLENAAPVRRVLLWLGAVVLFWPWIAAFAVDVMHTWLKLSSTALSLPIRTAASLPFVVLALLAMCWKLTSQHGSRPA